MMSQENTLVAKEQSSETEQSQPAELASGQASRVELSRLRLRRANRDEVTRVPALLRDLLPPEHPARQVWAVVEELDLSEFYEGIEVEVGRAGAPATDPQILVAVWLYATSQGETSAHKVNRLCVEHWAYIWLCGGVSMNYHTLSDFRVQHGPALDRLMTQVVRRLMELGLVEFNAHAQDGMRVRASAGAASFHREATLHRDLEQAQAQLTAVEQSGEPAPHALSPREQAAQERSARERAARLEAALAELPAVRAAKPVDERAEARVSSTDPEARVMKMADGGFRPAYNWEFGVDTAHLVILGVEVVNSGSDKAQAAPMLDQVQTRCGRLPDDWLMDGGFVTLAAIETATAKQVRVLAPVPEPKDKSRDPYTPLTHDSPAVAQWRQYMGTPEAKQTYKLRAATVECVNAQARSSNGVYQVRVRGRAKVRCVALWVALAHNLQIWIRHGHQPVPSAAKDSSV
jgi:transposase